MGSVLGTQRAAAARIGVTEEAYRARLAAGDKWCGGCRAWHPREAFGIDRSRSDGLSAVCLDGRVTAVGRPGTRARRLEALRGRSWCVDCSTWLPTAGVRQGRCREHRNVQERAYYQRTPALRERKRERTSGVPAWWRAEVFEEFGGLCAYGCGRPATDLEHIWPLAHGGTTSPANLVPACGVCNGEKRAGSAVSWIDRGLEAFPDQWEAKLALAREHAIDIEFGAVA